MKFLDLWRMSSSNLWKRKTRTILTVLGVVIGIASIVVMVSLGLGLNKSMLQEMEQNGGLTTITVYEGSNYDSMSSSTSDSEQNRLDDNLVEQISQMEHVDIASGVLTTNVVLRNGSYESQYAYVQAMKAEAFEKMNIPIGQGTKPKKDADKLEFLYGNQIITDFANRKTGRSYWETGELADIDLMNDDIFVIFDTDAYWSTQYNEGEVAGGENEQPVAPPKKYLVDTCGVVEGNTETYNQFSWSIYCDIDKLIPQLKKVFKNKAIPGQPTTATGKPYKDIYYNSIYVNVDDINNVTTVQKEISELGYQAESNMEWVESQQRQFGFIQLALGGIGAVSLLVAAIGITNTMMMSIYERTKEIGIIKVLGCDMRNIQTLFLMEAGMIGLIGGIIGGVLSYSLSALINMIAKASGEGGMMSQLSYIPPWLAILSLVFAVIVAMIAGFFPSLRAMKLSPLAAIRSE